MVSEDKLVCPKFVFFVCHLGQSMSKPTKDMSCLWKAETSRNLYWFPEEPVKPKSFSSWCQCIYVHTKLKAVLGDFFFSRLLCIFIFTARIPTTTREHVPAIASLYTTFPAHFRRQVKGVYALKEKVQTEKINVKEGLCWLAGWGLRKYRHWWNNNLAKCVHWEKPPVLCFTPLSLPCGAPWFLRSLQII